MEKFYRRVCDIEVILAMVLLGASVSIIFIAAVMRTAGHPIRWGNDLALMLFAWSTFISADIVFRIKRHVVVDILTSKLPSFSKRHVRYWYMPLFYSLSVFCFTMV